MTQYREILEWIMPLVLVRRTADGLVLIRVEDSVIRLSPDQARELATALQVAARHPEARP